MRLAVLLLCHKNPTQINMLINALTCDSIDIFVHVDKKSDITSDINITQNVYILPDEKRIDVKWATFSQIEAEINLLEAAYINQSYDYYWLISGQDYPIATTDRIIKRLESNKHINYVNLYPSKNNGVGKNTNYDKRNEVVFPDWMFKQDFLHRIIRRSWIELTGGYRHTYSFIKRKEQLNYYFGSQWWCLSKDFVSYLFDYIANNQSILDMFRQTSCPDESFFHTILMNSKYGEYREDYLHYIDWSEGGNSPKTLKVNDLDQAFDSDKLMVRKIDITFDSDIVSEINNRKGV